MERRRPFKMTHKSITINSVKALRSKCMSWFCSESLLHDHVFTHACLSSSWQLCWSQPSWNSTCHYGLADGYLQQPQLHKDFTTVLSVGQKRFINDMLINQSINQIKINQMYFYLLRKSLQLRFFKRPSKEKSLLKRYKQWTNSTSYEVVASTSWSGHDLHQTPLLSHH